MATWTVFYINTYNANEVIEVLKLLTSLSNITTGPFPKNFNDKYVFSNITHPDYLVIGNTQSDWVSVNHNSFEKLNDWGEFISNKFDTKVIMTIAQSVSSVYYFALYEKGRKVREIETCYSEDFDMIDFGEKFDFEDESPGKKVDYGDGEEYLFDFESIDNYCKHFGLLIQSDYNVVDWTILKKKSGDKKNTNILITKERPWWKIW